MPRDPVWKFPHFIFSGHKQRVRPPCCASRETSPWRSLWHLRPRGKRAFKFVAHVSILWHVHRGPLSQFPHFFLSYSSTGAMYRSIHFPAIPVACRLRQQVTAEFLSLARPSPSCMHRSRNRVIFILSEAPLVCPRGRDYNDASDLLAV